jgi:NTP pyrophosphatase (non-canonical NTP hydrolase)
MFKAFYHGQTQFQMKVERATEAYDDPTKFQYHMAAMTEELGEVLKADKRWKTHRNESYIPEEKLDELADVFLTAFNLSIWSGFTADQMQNAILKKLVENNKRLEKGK